MAADPQIARGGHQAIATDLKDVIILVPIDRVVPIETWLLGHGHKLQHSSATADGDQRLYALKELSVIGRATIERLGGMIVNEWQPGERQRSPSTSS